MATSTRVQQEGQGEMWHQSSELCLLAEWVFTMLLEAHWPIKCHKQLPLLDTAACTTQLKGVSSLQDQHASEVHAVHGLWCVQDMRIDFQFDKAAFNFNALPFKIPYPVPFKLLGDETKVGIPWPSCEAKRLVTHALLTGAVSSSVDLI